MILVGVVATKPASLSKEAHGERGARLDAFAGMAISKVVMFAIIAATAVTIGATANMTSKAQPSRPMDSDRSLAPCLHPVRPSLIGSGMLAVPVLAGARSAGIAGLLGKPSGFSRSLRHAPVFYALVAVGTVGGMTLSLLGVNPVGLLVFVAIVNGIAAAPFLSSSWSSPEAEPSWANTSMGGWPGCSAGRQSWSWPPPQSRSSSGLTFSPRCCKLRSCGPVGLVVWRSADPAPPLTCGPLAWVMRQRTPRTSPTLAPSGEVRERPNRTHC